VKLPLQVTAAAAAAARVCLHPWPLLLLLLLPSYWVSQPPLLLLQLLH
jgi:hypothetical protein